MNLQLRPGDHSASAPLTGADRRRITVVLFCIGIVASILILFQPWRAVPQQTIIWLSPAEFTSMAGPSRFTRFKYKVMNLTPTVWRLFQRAKQQILIEASFVDLSSSGDQKFLGGPASTNSDGSLAWILSASELTAFQKSLREMPEAKQLGRPRIQTVEGTQAGIFDGNSISGVGRSGFGVGVTATIMSPAIRLLVKAESTEPVESSPGKVVSLKTNLSLACRVLVPNGGGLVVLGAYPKGRSATNHWIILSPAIVNSRGAPAKPPVRS